MRSPGALLLALVACAPAPVPPAVSRPLPITLEVTNESPYDAVLWVGSAGVRAVRVGRLPAESETRFVLYPNVLPPRTPAYLVAVSAAGRLGTSPMVYATAGARVTWLVSWSGRRPAVAQRAGP